MPDTNFPLSTFNRLDGVQYVRISGAAAGGVSEVTRMNLNQFTNEEIVTALVTLCNYATELEQEIDRLQAEVKDQRECMDACAKHDVEGP